MYTSERVEGGKRGGVLGTLHLEDYRAQMNEVSYEHRCTNDTYPRYACQQTRARAARAGRAAYADPARWRAWGQLSVDVPYRAGAAGGGQDAWLAGRGERP
jgi:hypothetical protein